MIEALVAHYQELLSEHPETMPPVGWCIARVSYVAYLSPGGQLTALVPLVDRDAQTKVVPAQVKRAVNIAANFLCDNCSYLLGLDNKGRPDRTAQCFETAKSLHHRLLDGIDTPCAHAILAYFDNWVARLDHPVIMNADEKLLAGGNIQFMVDDGGQILNPLSDDLIRTAWENHFSNGDDAPVMRCLVTGDLAPIARLHPSIKGVDGAQSSGASLVSFNARAFESYGHDNEQGRNAPVSEFAAQAYTTALNYLLADPAHRVRLGGTTVVYWSEHKDKQNAQLMSILMGNVLLGDSSSKEDASQVLNATMQAIARGRYRDLDGVDLDATFHILGLAPSSARLVVKFYFKDSFGRMLDNIGKHYRRADVVRDVNDERVCLTPYQLLRAVEHPKAKKPVVSPVLNGPLLKAILEDVPYPQALYNNALLRIHATQEDRDEHVHKVTRARASIIRAYLIRNCAKVGYDEEGLTVQLNESRNETAYCLGRAFSILEQIQETANGKATITNRYFNAASTTPAAVYASLIRLAKAHLAKIAGKKPGLAVHLERQLRDVLGEERVYTFPKRLSLEEQGDFMLGYYHQDKQRYVGGKAQDQSATENEGE